MKTYTLTSLLLLLTIAVSTSLQAQTSITSEQSALDTLKAAHGWGSLPTPVLKSIARRLGNQENAKSFLEVADHAGLLPKVRKWNSTDTPPPDFVVHNWGTALSVYGTYPAEQKRYKEAQKAFEVSYLLYPDNPANWVSLAEVLIYQHDCSAYKWARMFLNYHPPRDTRDPDERATLDMMKTAEYQEMTQFMREVVDQCGGKN